MRYNVSYTCGDALLRQRGCTKAGFFRALFSPHCVDQSLILKEHATGCLPQCLTFALTLFNAIYR
jgi:hypothetical protein